MSVQIDGSTGNIIAIKADYSGDVSIGGTLTYEDVTNIDAVGLITARNGIKVDDLGVQVGTGATIDGATNTLTFLTNGGERLRIDSSGRLLTGTDTAANLNNAGGGSARQAKSYVFNAPATTTERYSVGLIAGASSATGAVLNMAKTRATTNTHTVVQDDDELGQIRFIGSDGTNYVQAARIESFVDGTPGSNDMPGRLIFSTTADGASSPTERMRIDSSGRLGLGTNSPGAAKFSGTASGVFNVSGTKPVVYIDESDVSDATAFIGKSGGTTFLGSTGGNLEFQVGASSATTRAVIDSSGRLGLGTNSPVDELHINSSSANVNLRLTRDTNTGARISGSDSTNPAFIVETIASGTATERMRIDSSGRLLVGTNTSRTMGGHGGSLQVSGTNFSSSTVTITNNANSSNGAYLFFSKQRSGSVGGNTILQSGDLVGQIRWLGADGTDMDTSLATIDVLVDGTPGSNDMPGRMTFSTTADGASSPTERWRIDKDGSFASKTSNIGNVAGTGITLETAGAAFFTRSSASPVFVNRTSNDGDLIRFYQDNNLEGSISVSGNTVSYNGAHLARWSQLPGGAARTEILRGSVLSNLDEMCEWSEEDNEQLNRMKVSNVEGDVNVAGVFDMWDDNDDTYTNDFYCAMTGDFVIRIAQGTTVARGDLLMSAGDGTAKPQDDDIVRSKTIAKVTSTTVSTTHSDGSYCVPCVLMAC